MCAKWNVAAVILVTSLFGEMDAENASVPEPRRAHFTIENAFGLDEASRKEVLRRLKRMEPPPREHVGRKIDIVPYVAFLFENSDMPVFRHRGNASSLVKCDLISWLVQLRTPEAIDAVVCLTRHALARGVRSKQDGDSLVCLQSALGELQDDCALDMLFEMQHGSFWKGDEAPRVCLDEHDADRRIQREDNMRNRLQDGAYYALVYSGSLRVVEALAEGNAFDARYERIRDESFSDAVRACVGIVGYPELTGKPLLPEELRRVKEIYKRYGKRYVPLKAERITTHPVVD